MKELPAEPVWVLVLPPTAGHNLYILNLTHQRQLLNTCAHILHILFLFFFCSADDPQSLIRNLMCYI